MGGSLLGAGSRGTAEAWQTQGAACLANRAFAAAAHAFFQAGNHDGGWRATGAELLQRADEVAANAPARARALRLRAVRAYAAGHAHADALAAARLTGDAQPSCCGPSRVAPLRRDAAVLKTNCATRRRPHTKAGFQAL
jgi:hypothetical protein